MSSSKFAKRRLNILTRHVTSSLHFETPPRNAKYASSCYFPSSCFLSVPLISIQQETANAKIFTFALPKNQSLNLPISSCIMMQGRDAENNVVSKPYNPISFKPGSFSLLIKQYSTGTVSTWAGNLKVGDNVSFCQFKGNLKTFQFPFNGVKKITMACTGTGITPHYQALIPIIQNSSIQVRLIYGNSTFGDIMLRKELIQMSNISRGRVTIIFVVGNHSDDKSNRIETIGRFHSYKKGWIDEEKLKTLSFSPSEPNSVMWICGTPNFYKTLAGSRKDKMTADSILVKLGYKENQVWRS